MVRFVGALGAWRVICGIIRRVWVVEVVIDRCTGRRWEIVRFRKVSRIVGMGCGMSGAIVGTVGASGLRVG
jgi:hypothetical protein